MRHVLQCSVKIPSGPVQGENLCTFVGQGIVVLLLGSCVLQPVLPLIILPKRISLAQILFSLFYEGHTVKFCSCCLMQ